MFRYINEKITQIYFTQKIIQLEILKPSLILKIHRKVCFSLENYETCFRFFKLMLYVMVPGLKLFEY